METIQPMITSTEDGIVLIFCPSDFDLQMISDEDFKKIITESKLYLIPKARLLFDHIHELGELPAFKNANKLFKLPDTIEYILEGDEAKINETIPLHFKKNGYSKYSN